MSELTQRAGKILASIVELTEDEVLDLLAGAIVEMDLDPQEMMKRVDALDLEGA